ncbi:hypothetical protein BDV11DRAFT_163158 [Aspergillus similis]
MFTIYPRPRPLSADLSTSTPTTSLPHLSYILSLDPLLDHRCAGYVLTHGRRCTTETNLQDRTDAIKLLDTATADLRGGRRRYIENKTLQKLALCVLCSDITHQAQARTLVERWRADIEAFVQGYGVISGLNVTDTMMEWDVVNMDVNNKRWRERVYRGFQWGFDNLRRAQLVPSMDSGFLRASRAPGGIPTHQHLQGSNSDWNGNADYEYSLGPHHEPENELPLPLSHERTTSTSTSTSTGHGTYTNPSTNAQHPPIGIPAQAWTHDSVFGLSPLAPEHIEMPHNHQAGASTPAKSKANTIERLRQPIDGDCNICLISLLDEPSDFDSDTDSGYTRATTDRLSSPRADSVYQWHDTGTGAWRYTDATRRGYAYHPVLSYVRRVEPDINVRRERKVGERKYPARPELSWCRAGCGVNYHKRCLDRWVAMAPSGLATCPSCRRRWVGGNCRNGGSSNDISFRGRT